MITLGKALQESGAAASIAQSIVHLDTYIGPILMLLIVLVVTMFLSDFMNTAAAAVVMAPIAILVAETMSLSVDPFLIAVAVGSSCAFLTPIGHESNAMVMKQGGYTFKDYFRVGLPLELIIIVITIPLILHFWPF
jgi:di/tricarboxylate transporter